MKRFFVLLLLTAVMTVTACGGADVPAGETQMSEETVDTEAPVSNAEESTTSWHETEEETKPENSIPGFDSDQVVLSFWILSDVHYGYSDQKSKLTAALNFINDRSPYGIDALLFAGDILNDSQANEIAGFRDVIDDYVSQEIPIFICFGPTHDLRDSTEKADRERISKRLGSRFTSVDIENKEELALGRRHTVINGYHFFAVDGEGYALSDDTRDWLRSQLEVVTKAEPDKPVFVMGHMEQFGDACRNFPQVVYFSGHSHIPFNTGDAVLQTTYTSVHIGGLAYFRQMSCLSDGYLDIDGITASYAQGYRVDVDRSGCVCLNRADFYYGMFINERWVIPAVNDDNHLKSFPMRRRDGEAPSFASDATAAIRRSESHPETVTVCFDAAMQHGTEPVTQYIVSLFGIGEDGKENLYASREISSLYMLYPNGNGMPTEYTVVFDDIPADVGLKVTVSAFDCWSVGSDSLMAEVK